MQFITFIFSSFYTWLGAMIFTMVITQYSLNLIKKMYQGKILLKHGYRNKAVPNKTQNNV